MPYNYIAFFLFVFVNITSAMEEEIQPAAKQENLVTKKFSFDDLAHAAERGDLDALYKLAPFCFTQEIEDLTVKYTFEVRDLDNHRQQSFSLLDQSAQNGNGMALLLMSLIFSNNKTIIPNVKQDLLKSLDYLQKSADNKCAAALFALGQAYRDGYDEYGIVKNESKAVEFFQRGAGLEDPECEIELGKMYYKGRGAAKNLEKARNLFERAAASQDEDIANIAKWYLEKLKMIKE